MDIINSYINKVSFIISPPFCQNCKDFLSERNIFCQKCFDKIKPVTSANLYVNSKYQMKVLAISDYKEPIRSLILGKASSNILSSKQIGKLIWQMTNIKNIEFDYLIPVPLHWTRYIKRGYNQAEIISNVLSKESCMPVANILTRNKYTTYQSVLSMQDRAMNVKNVFNVNTTDILLYKDKNLILVDDLLTSGSTLINAATALAKLKPRSINAVVACRVI